MPQHMERSCLSTGNEWTAQSAWWTCECARQCHNCQFSGAKHNIEEKDKIVEINSAISNLRHNQKVKNESSAFCKKVLKFVKIIDMNEVI